MAKVNITDAELNRLISESINRVLNESEMEEGLWNQLKQGVQGARQGFNAQKTFDRGTQGFKQERDHDDVMRAINNPLSQPENTAAEQANKIYAQYKQYQAMANKLLAQYNAMAKQYGLQKVGVGQMAAPANAPVAQQPSAPVSAPQTIKGQNRTWKGMRNYQPDMQSKFWENKQK